MENRDKLNHFFRNVVQSIKTRSKHQNSRNKSSSNLQKRTIVVKDLISQTVSQKTAKGLLSGIKEEKEKIESIRNGSKYLNVQMDSVSHGSSQCEIQNPEVIKLRIPLTEKFKTPQPHYSINSLSSRRNKIFRRDYLEREQNFENSFTKADFFEDSSLKNLKSIQTINLRTSRDKSPLIMMNSPKKSINH